QDLIDDLLSLSRRQQAVDGCRSPQGEQPIVEVLLPEVRVEVPPKSVDTGPSVGVVLALEVTGCRADGDRGERGAVIPRLAGLPGAHAEIKPAPRAGLGPLLALRRPKVAESLPSRVARPGVPAVAIIPG